MEQFAFSGIGASHADIRGCRFLQFGLVGEKRTDRACDSWSNVLTGYRISFSHAVRVDTKKLTGIRFSKAEIPSSTFSCQKNLQHNFLGFLGPLLHDDGIWHRLRRIYGGHFS